MALDYNNLPLLLTIHEVAEIFRCSHGTIRKRLASDPNWLRPAGRGLMRKHLFARKDVLELIGEASQSAAAWVPELDPWMVDHPELGDVLAMPKRERDRYLASKRPDA